MTKYGIILPVRNGGAYVKECVQSILSQTLPDLQLQVLDNCSTDGTLQWLESLADPRMSIYPAERPLTIEENWRRIVQIPKPEFITLIGHDDILDPHYLSTIDQLIRKHPEASLYLTHFRYIDSKGSTIRRCKPMDEIQTAAEFLAFILYNSIDTMGTGFVMRSRDYDAIGGIPPSYPNLLFADLELWIRLAQINYRATASAECFAFRLHQSATTTSTDTRFQDAYDKFISFLEGLKSQNPEMNEVIASYALNFIRFYNKGLAHRLIRSPKNKRPGQTVDNLIVRSRQYADRLVPNNDFDPDKDFSVKLARQIDSNPVFRRMFLIFKKLYSKPVYQ